MLSLLAFLIVGVGVVALVYAVTLYNGLVRLKNNVRQAWANIDVLLKQRHDEIPKLVDTCRQYMTYEASTLEKIMAARAEMFRAREAGNVPAVGAAESQLRGLLGGLFAVAENYPDLKANATFHNLQTRISQLESAISDRRELYNQSATLNNTRLEQVPDVFIAGFGDFPKAELLSFDAAETRDVNVGDLFKS